jgi:hypothetical protein
VARPEAEKALVALFASIGMQGNNFRQSPLEQATPMRPSIVATTAIRTASRYDQTFSYDPHNLLPVAGNGQYSALMGKELTFSIDGAPIAEEARQCANSSAAMVCGLGIDEDGDSR